MLGIVGDVLELPRVRDRVVELSLAGVVLDVVPAPERVRRRRAQAAEARPEAERCRLLTEHVATEARHGPVEERQQVDAIGPARPSAKGPISQPAIAQIVGARSMFETASGSTRGSVPHRASQFIASGTGVEYGTPFTCPSRCAPHVAPLSAVKMKSVSVEPAASLLLPHHARHRSLDAEHLLAVLVIDHTGRFRSSRVRTYSGLSRDVPLVVRGRHPRAPSAGTAGHPRSAPGGGSGCGGRRCS